MAIKPDADAASRAHLSEALRQIVTAAEPGVRLRAIARLRGELERIEVEAAADALRRGLSWREIGEALGISKQAAHRRHSRSVDELDRAAETEDAGESAVVVTEVRRAMRLARREALGAGAEAIGTEHLMLGLLACGDPAINELLGRYGVSPVEARAGLAGTAEIPVEAVRRARADAAAGPGARPRGIGLTPLAHRVLSHATAGASERPARQLTALDLLYALLRHDHGGAARTLVTLGVSTVGVRRAILAHAGRDGVEAQLIARAPTQPRGAEAQVAEGG